MRLDILVTDDARTRILERLAAGRVIEVVVAVDQVLDRLVGDLPDFVDVLLAAGRPAVGDRIGRDDAVLGDDEHRLVIAIAENINAVGTVDLGGLDLRSLCGSRCGECRDGEGQCGGACNPGHDVSP
jgi:hypothetical protein